MKKNNQPSDSTIVSCQRCEEEIDASKAHWHRDLFTGDNIPFCCEECWRITESYYERVVSR